MCELLGLTSKNKVEMNDLFNVFFSHSAEHPNGWGLALFDDPQNYVEKEPVKAIDSLLLKRVLSEHIQTSRCIAHIRRATIGDIEFNNTHPFYKRDDYGRTWTLAHNGTIFDSEILTPYQYVQEGTTDSERILLYIVDEINDHRKKDGEMLSIDKRIRVVEKVIRNIVPGNKLNLMIYDGELFYIHKNEPGTMYMMEKPERVLFSTKPLEAGGWKEVPQNRLLVYKDGENVYSGQSHDHTYIHDEEKMGLLYLEYSRL